MRLLLLLLLALPASASVTVEPGVVSAASSPEVVVAAIAGTTIAPAAVNAVTGSFSGSVTASSVTSHGDASVVGNLGIGEAASGTIGLSVKKGEVRFWDLGQHELEWGNGNIEFFEWLSGTGGGTILNNKSAPHSGGYISIPTGGAATMGLMPTSGSVGIGTASPCSTCTLHVAGGASVTGAFAVASDTFAVATTGIVSAPSQPYVRAPVGAAVLTNTVSTKLYFGTPAAGDNLASMYGGASSSGTFTVPSGGAGTYALAYHQYIGAVAGAWVIDFKKNGSAISGCYRETSSSNPKSMECASDLKLSAGDTIEVWVQQTGTVDLVPNTNAIYSYFTMKKDDL